MKIGIMGAHGVGKTTFAHNLAESLKGGLVEGTARECPWPVNRATTEESQQWIFHRQILRELEAEAEFDFVICDRTVLDGMAYAEVAGFKDLVMTHLTATLDWMRTYTFLYFMRPGGPGRLVDDGFRDTDPGFQAEVDGALGNWVKVYGLEVTEICGQDACEEEDAAEAVHTD